jgi:hypothetical protein
MPSDKKNEEYVTPIGTLNYPYLQVPRGYKGDTTKLSYDTQLILEGAAAAEFHALLDDLMQKAEQEFPGIPTDATPIAPVIDADKNVVEGKTAFKFRVPATSETKNGVWDRKPVIVDANGDISEALMNNEVRIGPGTKARISFMAYLRKNRGAAGVTLQPVGVQVVELNKLQRSTESLGFGKVEGKFKGSEDGSGKTDGDEPAPKGDIPF